VHAGKVSWANPHRAKRTISRTENCKGRAGGKTGDDASAWKVGAVKVNAC